MPIYGNDSSQTINGTNLGDEIFARNGDDKVYGGAGNDKLHGEAGSDALYGEDGDDELHGGAGSDILNGGAGTDTAVYAGSASDYQITRFGANAMVTDRNMANGNEGMDTLNSVERIRFGDGTILFLTANRAPGSVSDTNAAANSVAEGAANGTAAGVTAYSLDPDGDAVTYSLVNNAGGAFAIDSVTGVVSVADGSKLNFETATSHNIVVRATDAFGATRDQAFTIAVSNVAPTPASDVDDAANTVMEGAATGASVGITASASDVNGGSITYSLSDDAGGRFTIDATTGVVSVADATLIDYETATSHNITVVASDGTAGTSQTFVISVGNASPSVAVDSDAAANAVNEDATTGALVGITASSSDPNGGTLTYSLADDAGGRFAIDAATGVVTVADASLLDYETATSHDIIVQASDGTTQSSETFTIAVNNVTESQARVGYINVYGDVATVEAAIVRAGGIPVQLTTLTAENLATIDVLVFDGYAFGKWSQDLVWDAVYTNGLKVFINDPGSNWASFLPGFSGVGSAPYDNKQVDVVEDSPLVSGTGGVLTDSSLDNGNSSIHSLMELDSLPEGTSIHLTSAEDIAGVSLNYGAGSFVYTTMPLSFYLGNNNMGDAIESGMENYFVNVIEDLLGSDNNGPGYNIEGGNREDHLTGGTGDDTIFGGLGADQMTGNGGSDTFIFSDVLHSTPSAPDTILDFAHGVDKIDLSGIDADALEDGNQAFSFVGDAAFSGTGADSAGQLRAYNSSGSTWTVEGDTNGDGIADFSILVTVDAGQPLTGTDFVL